MAAFLCGEPVPRGVCCLTVTRWIVAAVVGAVAVTVLLLVLIVGLSSDGNVTVMVSHGHLQVANALWSMEQFNLSHYPNDHSSLDESDRTYTLAEYTPATQVDIWMSLNFRVPGGCDRNSKVHVFITVTVFDMPNAPSFLGMVNMSSLDEGIPREVCKSYHGKLDRWLTITNRKTLDYIAKTYGGRSEFTVMLMVKTTKTTTTEGDDTTSEKPPPTRIHYCWPVTVGHTRSIKAEPIICKPSHGIDYTRSAADAATLSPPPSPPPNPPPAPQICDQCEQN